MATIKALLILSAALLAALLISPQKTALADEAEIKVFLFFDLTYDTGLKLIEPGHGLEWLETETMSSQPENPHSGVVPGYHQETEPDPAPDPAPSPHPGHKNPGTGSKTFSSTK